MKHQILSSICLIIFLIGATVVGQTTEEGAKEEKIKISQLPDAVAQTLKTNCARCAIDKLTREIENGATIYDVEFKQNQGEIAIAADGSVIDRETVVSVDDVPAAALDAIRKGAAGAKIKRVMKGEIRAEIKDGQIIKLSSSRYVYEAELEKKNQVAEIEVTADGQIIEPPEWRRRGSNEN
jgi:uncharacterized membrane protein YkoI